MGQAQYRATELWHRPRTWAVMAFMAAGVAGCGPFGSASAGVASLHNGAQATPTASASDLEKYQAVVVCARQHGLPDVPDAHLDDHGQPQFPALPGNAKPPQSVLDGCKDLIAKLPQQTGSTRATLTAAALAQVRKFAACVRGKGYPNFPDPSADGSFSAPANSGALPAKDSRAFQDCRHLLPNLGR